MWAALLGAACAALAGCADAAPAGGPPPAASAPVTRAPAAPDPAAAPVPRRVVSVDPAATEILLALGAADRLVARTDFDTDSRLRQVPSLGRTLHPTAESVVALDADLVVASGKERHGGVLAARLRDAGETVYSADVNDIEGVFATTRRLGGLLGLSGRADSLVASLRAQMDALRACYGARPAPTVFFILWPDPPRSTGAGTFVHEVIGIAGGRNLFADVAAPWPVVSLEEVVRRQPDYVVVAGSGSRAIDPDALARLPGWRDLSAMREGRVVMVDTDLFVRPGPRVAEAARVLGEALHPDAACPLGR